MLGHVPVSRAPLDVYHMRRSPPVCGSGLLQEKAGVSWRLAKRLTRWQTVSGRAHGRLRATLLEATSARVSPCASASCDEKCTRCAPRHLEKAKVFMS